MKMIVLDEDKPCTFISLRRELKFDLCSEIDVLLPAPHKTGIGLLG